MKRSNLAAREARMRARAPRPVPGNRAAIPLSGRLLSVAEVAKSLHYSQPPERAIDTTGSGAQYVPEMQGK
jgi:hypothetical protein